jgi:hypothetical protein
MSKKSGLWWCIFLSMIVVGVVAVTPAYAQVSLSTGGISGIVTDPQGAAVPGARITITSKELGTNQVLQSSSAGYFTVGALSPGNYTVRAEAPNFKSFQTTVPVQVGQMATVNVRLELGTPSTLVEVTTTGVTVNSEQATVQDVLTAQDIEQLPVNGRNFLDLATLEPGVQIQDGSTFDPTKNGYSSLSFGGRFGRTARIEVDGVDISDETVGTTTQNIPQSAIEEFQVSSSSLDMSTELTSSGTVNVVTRSGKNEWHGQAFYYGRSNQTSAKIADNPDGTPADLPFGRKQFGGNIGGAFLPNKLFFFLDFERTDQSLDNPVTLGSGNPFQQFSGSYNSPFTEREYLARLDYNIKNNWTAFFRFNYDQNSSVRGFNPGVYQPFANVDYVPTYVAGTDFQIGKTTNSIRFEFLKFRNSIVDGVALSGSPDPAPGISLNITPNGSDLTCLAGGELFCSGTNILAPQKTYQEDRQIKYDGSATMGHHTLRYGMSYNGILGGGFASFFGIQPAVTSVDDGAGLARAFAAGNPYGPGGVSNPLNWPVSTILFGNGQGYSTETPGFGLPAGGQHDHRFDFYVGDQWKIMSNLTLTFGLHYGRDTGRTDSDLGPIPALAQFDNQFYNGLERRVNQPNLNFGPQFGFAWDPAKTGKTVIRGGVGLYYENAIFNNVLFDRPARLPQGLFFGTAAPCFGGQATGPVLGVNGGNPVGYCGEAIGTAMGQIAADQEAFQAATLAAGAASNPNYIGNALAASANSTGLNMLSPDYVSPRSVQMNIGVQQQVGHSATISVDYVRNVATHYLLGLDTNKVGDARFLNTSAAQAAISATNSAFGCGPSSGAAAIDCAIAAGAQITDYAGNGLDSGFDATGGFSCPTCAFGGINSNLGQNVMLFPVGRSVYNGLLFEFKANWNNPLPAMKHLNLIASYTLSRFDSAAADQDFVTVALDSNNPLRYYGPSALDRTNLISVGAVMDLPAATRFALTAHYGSAFPLTLTLPQAGTPGEIFRTDVTGDGTVGDPVPGTNVGAFGRTVKAGGLNQIITNYNNNYAGQLTPAGQALVTANLFSQSQLQQLGAVTPTLALAPQNQVGISPLFTFDMHVSWELRLSKVMHALPERVILEPQIALYNVFNFHNYDPVSNALSGVLNGAPGSANGTTKQERANLITPGAASGVNWYAVPRQAEFGVKLTF